MSTRVLVVEDEAAIRLALRGLLRKDGYDVDQVESAEAAIRKLEAETYDLVLTDLALGRGGSGMDVLRASKAVCEEVPVVVITAHGSEKIAVEAMKLGAEDYVPKPFDNDELRMLLRRALERTRLWRENRMLLERVEREYAFGRLIGSGPGMREVFETIRKVAETDLSVLVLGESGTGKELVAQALHQCSGRSARPFVAVNCAAISAELVESELFGHERGAFTGADARRIGRFESANGGSIFLDEIGDMAAATQAKVLRVLQERAFERVGGQDSISVDVRVIAATHRDLAQEVARERFREDLYYRLKVVEIRIPPLRERVEDIPALALRFCEQIAERLERPRKTLSEDALAALGRHPWPGNVRELRNVIEQAAVLSSGEVIEACDLRLEPRGSDSRAGDSRAGEGVTRSDASGSRAGPASPAEAAAANAQSLPFREAKRLASEAFEREFLLGALRAHDGNISRTAEAIGMVRQSLQQKIRELGLREELGSDSRDD